MKFSDYKIVIWGHKLHSHTHSYIHNGFDIAFKHLGFQTFWFDDNDDVSHFDFHKCLFITEGQVDKKIPLREDCFYVLHNCDQEKYRFLFDKKKCITLQVYTDDVLSRQTQKIETCIHYDVDGKCLYMPWATDLLPHQIDAHKPQIAFRTNNKNINWVGTIGGGKFGNIDQINPFKNACKENGITFLTIGGKNVNDNIQLIKTSYMAPAIVGNWQQEVGYVPCRIFKNISYGQFGLTNSPRVYELFDHKIFYNNDTRQLFYEAKDKLMKLDISKLHELMDFVKTKHTYINRINTVLDFMEKISA